VPQGSLSFHAETIAPVNKYTPSATTLSAPRPLPAAPARITIVTDAWAPQVNGVVRTLEATASALRARGDEVTFITPQDFKTIPCPTYAEISLAINMVPRLGQLIEQSKPDFLHISTEGPLGIGARLYCSRRGLKFSTAYHTKFPEYVHARFRIPLKLSYGFMRWFHKPSTAVMCATQSIAMEIGARGINRLAVWSRGVDLELFRPHVANIGATDILAGYPRPLWLYVGRVSVEKSVEDFLKLDLEGTKLVIGDGPQLEELKEKYPGALFTGALFGKDLAAHYAASDVFVFPSRTDTFGLVIIEALASGLPVAAYPVPGPIDIIADTGAGVLSEDLAEAARQALKVPRLTCRALAQQYSWENCTQQFRANLTAYRSPD
jgi:glycosyltransferase involved in cell wall biosynthesis